MDDLPNGFTGFAKRGSNFTVPKTSERNRGEEVPFTQEEIDAIPEYQRRWSWVEIDTKAIQHNVREARRFLRPGVRLMAVVKADGYGHGAVQLRPMTALSAGAECAGRGHGGRGHRAAQGEAERAHPDPVRASH